MSEIRQKADIEAMLITTIATWPVFAGERLRRGGSWVSLGSIHSCLVPHHSWIEIIVVREEKTQGLQKELPAGVLARRVSILKARRGSIGERSWTE